MNSQSFYILDSNLDLFQNYCDIDYQASSARGHCILKLLYVLLGHFVWFFWLVTWLVMSTRTSRPHAKVSDIRFVGFQPRIKSNDNRKQCSDLKDCFVSNGKGWLNFPFHRCMPIIFRCSWIHGVPAGWTYFRRPISKSSQPLIPLSQ